MWDKEKSACYSGTIMELTNQNRIEDFIKTLEQDELIYLNRLVVERIKLLSQLKASQLMTDFNLGDTVGFVSKDGRPIRGIITKLNKKTISIKTTDNEKWNVSPYYLQKKQP